MSQPIKRTKKGYTLIELMVTLSIITLIGVTGLPQLAISNDKTRLNSAANTIRQIITDARTRSLAPGSGEYATKQVFEVRMGQFEGIDSALATASGSRQTNRVGTYVGVASCEENYQIAQEQLIREYNLPRGIYISRFYPTNNFPGDKEVLIRFSVGKLGFVCGATNSTLFDSTNFGSWVAKDEMGQTVFAQYLVLELSSTRSEQKKYIAVDRQTAEITITDSDPQRYLQPVSDLFAPQWTSNPNDLTTFANLETRCFTQSSEVNLSFKRARDRINVEGVDANLAVYYDISWSTISDQNRFEPLVLRYYYDVDQDVVSYRFTTDQITIPNQPSQVFFRIVARDSNNNLQSSTDPNDLNKPALISFAPNCGPLPIDEGNEAPEQGVDQWTLENCENQIVRNRPNLFERMVGSALAMVPTKPARPCPTESTFTIQE